MKKLLYGTLVALLLAGQSVPAQETPVLDYVLETCAADLVQYCDDVNPGEGRLLYCLAAYGDQISDSCIVALYQATDVLMEFVDAIAYVADACSDDIESYCAETEPGDGRILDCLEGKRNQLSETCSTAMSEVLEE